MKLIGLVGKAGSGKDSVAQIIGQLRYPKTTIVVPFAMAIKEEARKHGWNGDKDTNGRALLQYMGVRERQGDPEHWIRKSFSFIDTYARASQSQTLVAVITDVRFRNEATAILNRGGELWRVERPGYDNGLTDIQKQHISEVEMDNYNIKTVITNTSSMDDLRRKVAETFHED